MDDIKRALEHIYAAQKQEVTEAPPADAAANMSQAVELKGSFNAKAFGGLLGMTPAEASLLVSFVNKHKRGTVPNRAEALAAADVFRALIDADNATINKAMSMLRRITADTAKTESVDEEVVSERIVKTVKDVVDVLADIRKQSKLATMGQGEPVSPNALVGDLWDVISWIEHNVKPEALAASQYADVNESVRATKDGLDECWSDMAPASMSPLGSGNPGEKMTVNISMPGKNISVTTDSAEEIMNVLKLAGIEVNGESEEGEEDEAEEGEGSEENTWTPPLQSNEPIPVVVKSEGEETKEAEQVDEEDIDENAYLQAAAAAARLGKDEFEFPKGSGKMHPVKMDKDTAHQMESSDESARILQLAGIDESKLANAPAGTSMDEPTEYDSLPSGKGTGAGKPDYGTRQSNMGGENPMAHHNLDIDEAFNRAMGEYRKFVAESIKSKK